MQTMFVMLIVIVLRLFLVPEPKEIGLLVDDEVLNEKVSEELSKIICKSRNFD